MKLVPPLFWYNAIQSGKTVEILNLCFILGFWSDNLSNCDSIFTLGIITIVSVSGIVLCESVQLSVQSLRMVPGAKVAI